ncbi:alanyl-tRNA editing protein [Fictibacillus gelatini]|uniref:alanyl-tRNA editing protein n=1 Tax=Fictibacillus gelatini TaxID=225985 RepID=UPI002ADD4586|nr:DHHA1 domain-containing protein [Fictibacillus gelatini]
MEETNLYQEIKMTEKLFYKDAYLKTFTSSVIKQDVDENGRRYVVLEKTAFYPTGGGQPCDIGAINGVRVNNVEEIDGEIRHYVESKIEPLNEIIGEIDWERRFDHMQQHAGQHLLSAAFDELFGMKTIAFHLGKEFVTIDLDVHELLPETSFEAEMLANKIVFENRSINTRWIDRKEIAKFPLRKPPSVNDNIRLVIIDDFDYNAFGGTHPKQTGEVGPVKIIKWERHKQHTRLYFVCGMRAVNVMHEKQMILHEACKVLTCGEQDVVSQLHRLLGANNELEKSLKEATTQLMRFEAEKLIEQSLSRNHIKFITSSFGGREMKELQTLANQIVELDDSALVLFVTTSGERMQLIGARGKNVAINMNEIVKQALNKIEGKGGGSMKIAQGGGKALLSNKEMLQYLLELAEGKIISISK